MGDCVQGGGRVAAEGLHGFAQIPRLVETLHAVFGLRQSRADVQPLAKHHGPAHDAHYQKHRENDLRHQRRLSQKRKNAHIHAGHLVADSLFQGKRPFAFFNDEGPGSARTLPGKQNTVGKVISVSGPGCNGKLSILRRRRERPDDPAEIYPLFVRLSMRLLTFVSGNSNLS